MNPSRSGALSAPVQPFTFHDTTLDVARDNGDLWVSIRRVCEALGLSRPAQQRKLKEKTWARVTVIGATGAMNAPVGADGNPHEQLYIHLDALPMWLATIEPSRVSSEARPRLERFQLECARALRDHFFGSSGHAAASAAADLLDEHLERRSGAEHVARLEHAVATARASTQEAARAALGAFLFETESPRFVHRALETKILVELARYCAETDGGHAGATDLQLTAATITQANVIQRARRDRRDGWFVDAPPRAAGLMTLHSPEDHDEHQVVAALADVAGAREWTAAELLGELAKRDGHPNFRGSAKSLGRLLARYRDHMVNGRALRARRSPHAGMLLWRFEDLPPAS